MAHQHDRDAAIEAFERSTDMADQAARLEFLAVAPYHALMAIHELRVETLDRLKNVNRSVVGLGQEVHVLGVLGIA